MPARILDAIDRQMLALLQDDGRMTNVDLAAQVGLTAPPALRRVRALEESGVIEGYHAQLNPASLGFSILVFVMVSLRSQAAADLQAFEEHIAALDPVRECYLLNGEFDFVLKVVARDLQEFQQFLTSALTTAPNVAHVRTSLVIKTAKYDAGVPIDQIGDAGA